MTRGQAEGEGGQPGYPRFTSIASTLGRNPFMAFGERFIAPLLPLRKKLAKKGKKITATRIKMLPGATQTPPPPFCSPHPFAHGSSSTLPNRRAVVVKVEIYIRPTKSPRMRMRMRIGDGEADGVEGWNGMGKGLRLSLRTTPMAPACSQVLINSRKFHSRRTNKIKSEPFKDPMKAARRREGSGRQ